MRAGVIVVAAVALAIAGLGACVDKKKDEPQQAAPVPPQGAPPSPTGSTSGPLTAQQCEALMVDGEKQLAQIRPEMSKECTIDAECAVTFSTVCLPGCPDYPMTKGSSFEYSQRRDQIDSVTCKRWREADCDKITPKPKPNCTAMKGVCQNKQCVAVTK